MQKQVPGQPEIPDKFYFRIGEVSEITGVPTHVLRFWESEFKRLKPKRTDSGQRLYRKIDVETVLNIKNLLYDRKYTIKGAKENLSTGSKTQDSSVPSYREIRKELLKIRKILSE